MAINVGTLDRILRVVLGVVLLWLAFFSGVALFDGAVVKTVAAVAGVIMLGTAALSRCPLYSLFGIKTCGGN